MPSLRSVLEQFNLAPIYKCYRHNPLLKPISVLKKPDLRIQIKLEFDNFSKLLCD